ncbi:MAG: acyl-[acyl-carrier-protein]--UDP-N-acetylglucosamine O-acyltransferase [Planctomycetota bacterium]|nr:MAG: acyl-[acyl-carrier-protein]--UDP-N-acetylglucosamine O-acyltransferase [Planctomycetota bacterium]
MPKIAPSATVDPKAQLADDVEIGPGCYVGPKVTIGAGTVLMPNVTILGKTTIGKGNLFYPSTVIGAAPQDLKYKGTDTELIIGDENIFREGVTAHTGTEVAGGVTKIGSHNQFQVGTHLAHDVFVDDHCILSNQVQVAGHVHIESNVTISGLVGIQQFVTIGRYSFITGMARCTMDAPPYMIYGYEGSIQGVNVKGLGRWGFDEQAIQQLRDVYKKLFPKKSQSTNHYSLRSLYGLLPGKKEDRNGAAVVSLARRLSDVETMGNLGEHTTYLIEFLKRSIHAGVYGRYLESLRRDGNGERPRFYTVGGNGR